MGDKEKGSMLPWIIIIVILLIMIGKFLGWW